MKKNLIRTARTTAGLLQELLYATLITGIGSIIALAFAR